jgi:hypothetical protein
VSSRAAFFAVAVAVLAATAVPWSNGPLRRLAGNAGEGRDPTFDVKLNADDLRAAARMLDDSTYAAEWPDGSPLQQGNLKAAAQLYFARGLPVIDPARAKWIVWARDGRVELTRSQ